VKRLIFIFSLVLYFSTASAHAEVYLKDYGYYENVNEITAKDRIIGAVDNIFDFKAAANPGGERIGKGRYYIPISYRGGNNGVDEDYIYLDEMLSQNSRSINNTSHINRLDSQVTDLNNRLNKLEDTQQVIGGRIRVYDSRKWQVNIFADYSINREQVDRAGIRFTFKFGESYEERRLNELEQRLKQLED